MRAYVCGSWPREQQAELRGLVDPGVELCFGDEAPEDYEMLVCGRPTGEMMEASSLRWLVIPWAGLPSTAARLAAEHAGVRVHNLHHNAPAAAELAVSLLLAAGKRIVEADRNLRRGDWTVRYSPENAMLLCESRVLVVGLGEIGMRVARACRSMEAEVVGLVRHAHPGELRDGFPVLPPDALHGQLEQADAAVLSVPLTDETRGMIGERELSLLGPRGVLVNVGRGGLVEEESLHSALSGGRLGAAGIDVWYRYPRDEEARSSTRPSDLPFEELDNVVMSPHRGGALNVSELESRRARALAELMNAAAGGGEVPHRIDLGLGY
jgi:phosphoglycerate dehydrogenase-like enzyme